MRTMRTGEDETFRDMHGPLHLYRVRHTISGHCSTACALPNLRGRTPVFAAARAGVDDACSACAKPYERLSRIRNRRHWDRIAAVLCNRTARVARAHEWRQYVVGLHSHAR